LEEEEELLELELSVTANKKQEKKEGMEVRTMTARSMRHTELHMLER
jgi:hypothetical protein